MTALEDGHPELMSFGRRGAGAILLSVGLWPGGTAVAVGRWSTAFSRVSGHCVFPVWSLGVRLVVELIVRVWRGGCLAARVWGSVLGGSSFLVWAPFALSIRSTLHPPILKVN